MSNRDQNRADFPTCTEMFDMIRETHPAARILWASENGKELGKRPAPDPGTFEISAETWVLLQERKTQKGKRK